MCDKIAVLNTASVYGKSRYCNCGGEMLRNATSIRKKDGKQT